MENLRFARAGEQRLVLLGELFVGRIHHVRRGHGLPAIFRGIFTGVVARNGDLARRGAFRRSAGRGADVCFHEQK